MSLLKKENWLVCLILIILTEGFFNLVLAYLLDLFDKNAWYANYKNWIMGALFFIFPVFIMLFILQIQMLVSLATKLKVPGSEIYGNFYIWILCLIVPVIGWIMLTVMMIYIAIWPAIMIKNGHGEQF